MSWVARKGFLEHGKGKEELVCSPMLNVLFWEFISVKVGLADIDLFLLHMYLHAYPPALFNLGFFTCIRVCSCTHT